MKQFDDFQILSLVSIGNVEISKCFYQTFWQAKFANTSQEQIKVALNQRK